MNNEIFPLVGMFINRLKVQEKESFIGTSCPYCDTSFKATYNPNVWGDVYKKEALVKLDRALIKHVDECHPGMKVIHRVFQPAGLVIDARLA